MTIPDEFGTSPSLYNPRQNDIFISYADADLSFVKRLDAAIRQTGRDPWVNWDDVPLEADEWKYVEEGIKEVDSFIFVISPASIVSEKNRAELDLAVEYDKQIIPILWQPVDPELLPEILQNLPPVTARRGETVAFERLAKKIFYMHTHARLHRRAEEWGRRNEPPDLLLSLSDLDAIDRWRSQNSNREFQLLLKQLSPLEKRFLEASENSRKAHKPTQLDFFISYSRRDKEFVRKLYNRFKAEGKTPWIDWENIPVATDWQQEINQGIEAAHTVLFVLSHRALESEFCFKEIAHAVFCARRVIPIVFLQNPEKSAQATPEAYVNSLIQKLHQLETEKLPPALRAKLSEKRLSSDTAAAKTFTEAPHPISRYQTVQFDDEAQFEESFRKLWQVIGTDLALVEQHRALERKAHEWDENQRSLFLLEYNSQKLRAVERLLQQCDEKQEAKISVTPLQRKYVRRSREVRHVAGVIVASLLTTLVGTAIVIPKLGEVKALVSSLEEKTGLDALLVALKAGKEMQSGKLLYQGISPDLPVRAVTAIQQEIKALLGIG